MRLRNFIIDIQKIAPGVAQSSFTATSTAADGDLLTTLTPKLLPTPHLFRGATLEVDEGSAAAPSFFSMVISGSTSLENVWTGAELKMTGSLSEDFVSSDKFHVIMISEATFTG